MIASRSILSWSISILVGTGSVAGAGPHADYILQKLVPSGPTAYVPVSSKGDMLSPLPILAQGAIFELWSTDYDTGTSTLLDATYSGAYVPLVGLTIRSDDNHPGIPRTRADKPFHVDLQIDGLLNGEWDPEVAKSVGLFRHVQSYGAAGTGLGIDRSAATQLSQTAITTNGPRTFTYTMTSIPGTDPTKVRGEERFSVFTVEDLTVPTLTIPPTQLVSRFIQIWPMADAAISGISEGQVIDNELPELTLTLNDLYPTSRTYAQVYKGSPRSNVAGTVVPGSNLIVTTPAPSNGVLKVRNYNSVFDSDGLWTLEVLTETVFGTDRLASVSFILQGVVDYQSLVYLSGNGIYIPDGHSIPATSDHTDFDDQAVRTFTIQNTAIMPLTLGGSPRVILDGPDASDFTVTRQPDSPVAAGESTTFEITFAPSAHKIHGATVIIPIGDPVSNSYDFAIQATGTSIENWRLTHFESAANSGDGSDLNDFDNDGIVNLLEYAFDLNPKQASNGLLPAPQAIGECQVFDFLNPPDVSGITYGAEWSTTLLPDSWTPVIDTGVAPQHVFSIPTASRPKLYLRLKVTRP